MDGEQVASSLARQEVQLLHLTERLEDFGDTLETVAAKLETHATSEEKRLRAIEDHLSFAKTLIFFGKTLLAAIVLVATLRFGDLAVFFKNLMR